MISPIVVRDMAGKVEERLDYADMYTSWDESWEANQTYQVQFTAYYSDAFKLAFNTLQYGAIVTDMETGQQFDCIQVTANEVQGVPTKQVTATHISTRISKNVRINKVTTGDISWTLDRALHYLIDGNDQGASFVLHGSFPNATLTDFGNCSLEDFNTSHAEDYDFYMVPDNKVFHYYSSAEFKHKTGKTYHYGYNFDNPSIEVDVSTIVNEVHAQGKQNELPENAPDNAQPTYAVDFTWQNKDSISKYGLHRGDPTQDERFTNQQSMSSYLDSSQQIDPLSTFSIDYFGEDTVEKGDTWHLIANDLNLNVDVTLLSYDRNRFNHETPQSLVFANNSKSINDINYLISADIKQTASTLTDEINRLKSINNNTSNATSMWFTWTDEEMNNFDSNG